MPPCPSGAWLAAYAALLLFSLAYGYAAAHNRRAERVLLPLLDVLQSVPDPVVPAGGAAQPERHPARSACRRAGRDRPDLHLPGLEHDLRFYQSISTIPNELREAAAIFRFNPLAALQDRGAAVCRDSA